MRIRWPDRSVIAPVIIPAVNRAQARYGFPDVRESVRLAKFVYRTGGWLWNRFHWVHALEFAMMAEDMDPVHFPHWAEYDEEADAVCPVCGGHTQRPLDGWFAVATTEREDEGL